VRPLVPVQSSGDANLSGGGREEVLPVSLEEEEEAEEEAESESAPGRENGLFSSLLPL